MVGIYVVYTLIYYIIIYEYNRIATTWNIHSKCFKLKNK